MVVSMLCTMYLASSGEVNPIDERSGSSGDADAKRRNTFLPENLVEASMVRLLKIWEHN